jgi:tetratricopeptide (TPR) repeat protein
MGILDALFGKDDLGEGMQRLLRGEYEEAIERFTRVLERDPGNAQAWFHRGIAYLESGRPEAAIRDFTESLRRREEPEAYYNRAMAWLDLRDLERALADLDAVLRLNPEDAEAWNMRAIVEAERGNYARALRDIREAIERGHPSGFVNQATILERAGRLQEALASLDRAIEERPDDVMAWAKRGLLRERLGDLEGARRDLREAWRRRRKLEEEGREALLARVEEALRRLG